MSTLPIAIVTASTRGLGRQTAIALAGTGTRVVTTYRKGAEEAVAGTIRAIEEMGGEAVSAEVDLLDPKSIDAFAGSLPDLLETTWGQRNPTILVNMAGVGIFGTLDELTVTDFETTFDTNVRGTFLLIKAVVPLLESGARIINVSSLLTRYAMAGSAVYSASKAAIEGLSYNLAAELGPRGIRVNVVAPGATATDFYGGSMRDDDSTRAWLAGTTALRRVGEPEDIADAIAAIASPAFGWATAQRIEVSGALCFDRRKAVCRCAVLSEPLLSMPPRVQSQLCRHRDLARMELPPQGTQITGLLVAMFDIEMTAGVDVPKALSRAIVTRALDGIEGGVVRQALG